MKTKLNVRGGYRRITLILGIMFVTSVFFICGNVAAQEFAGFTDARVIGSIFGDNFVLTKINGSELLIQGGIDNPAGASYVQTVNRLWLLVHLEVAVIAILVVLFKGQRMLNGNGETTGISGQSLIMFGATTIFVIIMFLIIYNMLLALR